MSLVAASWPEMVNGVVLVENLGMYTGHADEAPSSMRRSYEARRWVLATWLSYRVVASQPHHQWCLIAVCC